MNSAADMGKAEPDVALAERIEANLVSVRRAIAEAAGRVARDPAGITMVAISKGFGLPYVEAAARFEVRHFGENRIQEAEAKIPVAPEGLKWHMVGHLQRNKAKLAAGLFAVVQSVDGLPLAQMLDRHASRGYPVLIQVNMTGNPDQHGVAPDELGNLVRAIAGETSLTLDGLMTIAPFVEDQAVVRAAFRRLRELRETVRALLPGQPWTHLSMGMTNDFQFAVEEGATLVRIGRAIFGERR